MPFEYKQGRPAIDKDGSAFIIQGDKFHEGAVNELCRLIGGEIIKEEENKIGQVYYLFEWIITINGSKLNAIVKVPYYFSNEGIFLSEEQFIEIAEDAILIATRFLNEEFRKRGIFIMDRTPKQLDGDDKRRIAGLRNKVN